MENDASQNESSVWWELSGKDTLRTYPVEELWQLGGLHGDGGTIKEQRGIEGGGRKNF